MTAVSTVLLLTAVGAATGTAVGVGTVAALLGIDRLGALWDVIERRAGIVVAAAVCSAILGCVAALCVLPLVLLVNP